MLNNEGRQEIPTMGSLQKNSLIPQICGIENLAIIVKARTYLV